MFLIMGINQGEKQLEFRQPDICPRCGRYGSYEVFVTYTYFSLFFIPLFRWNKRYYVKTSYCNTVFLIDKELGQALERGQKNSINREDLREAYTSSNQQRKCLSCGYVTDDDRFIFCPICGHKL
jgi:RNA polymerase subunit RPABC4/transcription elongation factor Spt4